MFGARKSSITKILASTAVSIFNCQIIHVGKDSILMELNNPYSFFFSSPSSCSGHSALRIA